MKLRIGFDISINRIGPVGLQLALLPRPEEEVRLESEQGLVLTPNSEVRPYLDAFGNRRVLVPDGSGPLRLQWDAFVEDDGQPDTFDLEARQTPVYQLPQDTLQFLAPSRYCESDVLMTEAWQRFGHIPEGWARVQAITTFVHNHVEFGYGYAHPTKTAVDAMRQGRGVCRDYAHLTITFLRAMNMPARYISGYLGDIGVPYAGPGDFCAWVEVYIGGAWRTVDARYNTPRIGRVRMVMGRDAVDVPMIASFGTIQMTNFTVWCDEVTTGQGLDFDGMARFAAQ